MTPTSSSFGPRRHRPIVIYVRRLLETLRLEVLPITAEIAQISRGSFFPHGDPADRLVAATALVRPYPLITADETLRQIPQLNVVWQLMI